MKKNFLRFRILLPAALMCLLVLGAGAAANVSTTDPLVTLSYLNGSFKTSVLEESEQNMQGKIAALEAAIGQRIDGVKSSLNVGTAAASTHTTAHIPAGSGYSIPGGSEFLFLSGSAKVTAAGLTDLTDGTALDAQGELLSNHLYAASSGVSIHASSSSMILIRR